MWGECMKAKLIELIEKIDDETTLESIYKILLVILKNKR